MDVPLTRFRRAAIAWAAGGRGGPLVDAAARALADGLDTPTLRMLAGAPAATADDEAQELAARVFEELGLSVPDRSTAEAVVEEARLVAGEAMASEMPVVDVVRDLARRSRTVGGASNLADFEVLDDEYDLLELGHHPGSRPSIDRRARRAIDSLVSGAGPLGLRVLEDVLDEGAVEGAVEGAPRHRRRRWFGRRR